MKKLQSVLTVHQNKLIAAGLMVVSSASFAETGAAAAFTAVNTQVAEYEGYTWPVILSVTGAFIGIKLFKKFVNKAV
jgi:Phage major coat protein, Gp8